MYEAPLVGLHIVKSFVNVYNYQQVNYDNNLTSSSDLLTVDDTLFCLHSHPPDNALPLYLGHFQFTDVCKSEVLCIVVTYRLIFSTRDEILSL